MFSSEEWYSYLKTRLSWQSKYSPHPVRMLVLTCLALHFLYSCHCRVKSWRFKVAIKNTFHFTTLKTKCYSKMSADVGAPDSDNPNIAMAKELWKAGKDLKNLMTDKPELSKDLDIGFLKVFGEVVSAVGLLFKNDDVEQKLQQLLAPLSSYTSLMPYFLLIKTILGNVQRAIEVDLKEHKDRLQWVNKELTRIAVEAAAIAQKLEDLGNSLIDIIRAEDSKKAANLKIFDIHYNKISLSLTSCISDMELVKRKIDVGLSSIKGFTKKINYITIGLGVFAVALAIIAPISVGYYVAWVATYGVMDMIGVAAVAALPVGGAAALVHWKGNKSAKEIKQFYLDQEYNWQQLDEKLKTMKKELKGLRQARMTA